MVSEESIYPEGYWTACPEFMEINAVREVTDHLYV